jgi:hypothetical protein
LENDFMNDSNSLPPLGETMRDKAMGLVKGTIGTLPVAGSILAELVGFVVPNQRIDRLEVYCRHLQVRLDELGASRERICEPASVDLFEDGAYQAVRALSEGRKAQIALIVANGISGDDHKRIEAKRILSILQEIDDQQIIVLSSYLHRNYHDNSFQERHRDILIGAQATINSSREEFDQHAVQKAARDQLFRLGLLQQKVKIPKKGESPEFDPESGMLKASSRDLTPLGRLLLRHIGLAAADEF